MVSVEFEETAYAAHHRNHGLHGCIETNFKGKIGSTLIVKYFEDDSFHSRLCFFVHLYRDTRHPISRQDGFLTENGQSYKAALRNIALLMLGARHPSKCIL